MINRQMQERDTDMEILKCALRRFSEEINDATLVNSGHDMSIDICDVISGINIMLRAAELMRELNVRNCSLTELACVRARAMWECPCESEEDENSES